jgi:hypothetical protein
VAILAVAVLATATVVLLRREKELAKSVRAAARLLRFDDRRVKGLVVETGGKVWRFEQEGEGWRVAAPVRDAADATRILELLAAMRRTPVVRVIDDAAALSEYGLDPAVATVRLEGVEAPALRLGDAAPTGEGLFASVEGRPGVLVLRLPDGAGLLHPDPNELRDASIAGLLLQNLTTVEISAASGKTVLERGREGWWITSPLRLPASDIQMERLLGALEKSKVRRFEDGLEPGAKEIGLGEGALRITLRGPSAVRTVVLGAPTGTGLRYVARDDRSRPVAADAAPLDGMPLDVAKLGETRLTKTNRYEVKSFTYRAGGRSFGAVREGKDEWKDSGGTSLAPETVYALLVGLLEAATAGYDVAKEAALAPTATLEFEIDGGGRDRIDFVKGGKARVASIPGVTFRLVAEPPPVP